MSAETIDNIYKALYLMVQGMGGIFIVLGAIYIAIKLLIKIFPEKRSEK